MTIVHGTLQTRRWTIGAIADEFGMDWRTVRSRMRDANVEPAGTDRGKPVYALRDVAEAVFAKSVISAKSDDFDPETYPPKERKDWYEGEKIRIALEVQQGELVTLEDFRAELARVLKQIAATLETLPDAIDRKCHLSPDAIEQMQKLIDEQRLAIAERLEAPLDHS